jgi:hypothetical protein
MPVTSRRFFSDSTTNSQRPHSETISKKAVVDHGTALGVDVEIVKRNPQNTGFVPQPKRWRVEQTYGILILHRRLVRDYEHHPASSVSRVYWAMTQVMVRRLTGANTPTWREAQAVSA